jgi:aminoglycoside phosphotransferase family enzyme/predicted kinase
MQIVPSDMAELAAILNAAPDRSDRRETHISQVYLTRNSAYKRLKPVRFDFLDFSTREARYFHLTNEARLNRRLAPDVYRGLMPLWQIERTWRVDGTGPPDDWLLAMVRLPEEATLEAAHLAGRLTNSQLDRVLDRLVPFFRSAPRSAEISANGDPEILRRNLTENLDVLDVAAREGQLDAALVRRLRSRQLQALEQLTEELQARGRAGWIRDGHGDLRAEHIYLTEPIRIVDCIAFNHQLRWIDVADDLSFLATDLIRLEAPAAAAYVTNVYRERMNDSVSDALLALYRSYRFAVRAKVAVLRERGEEKRTVEPRCEAGSGASHAMRATSTPMSAQIALLAAEELAQWRPWFVAVCGLSGSGKTTVAASLARRIGAVVFSSDLIRKELHGLEATRRGDGSLYSTAANERTYAELLSQAAARLAEGANVVLDATFLRSEDREAVFALGTRMGIPPLFVECRCPESEAERRLVERQRQGRDASDATLDVRQRQRSISDGYVGLPAADHLVVDTTVLPAAAVDEIVSRLKAR